MRACSPSPRAEALNPTVHFGQHAGMLTGNLISRLSTITTMQTKINPRSDPGATPSADLTAAPPSLAQNLPRGWVNASSLADAEWMSLPRPRERDRYANLSRTTLLEMLDRGDVRGCVQRRPGALRGKRLVQLPSLKAHLDRLADEETVRRQARQTAAAKQPGTGGEL